MFVKVVGGTLAVALENLILGGDRQSAPISHVFGRNDGSL